MTILQRGITGFFDLGSLSVPTVALGEFKRLCFPVARQVGGSVEVVRASGITPNFHYARIDRGSVSTGVLCNAHFRILACCVPFETNVCDLEFVDDADLTAAMSAYSDYVLLPADSFDKPLEEADLHNLSQAEIAQIRYLRPARVGDAVFNWWD